jgi:dephospho-CoA kinase
VVLLAAVTGGIGAGKSTASRRLAELGAVVLDSDVLAREVVAPGTPGLAAVADRFGSSVVVDGALDRAALAGVVFGDAQARRDLESITHPLIRQAFADQVTQAPADAVVVNDIPLLVTQAAAAGFQLTVGVGLATATRVRRLVDRGHTEADARARISAQIDDEQRRRLCDVWLTNDGAPEELGDLVSRLWVERIVPFRDNLLAGRAAPVVPATLPDGSVERTRLRLSLAAGVDADAVEVTERDGVLHARLTCPDERLPALTAAGFPESGAGGGRRGSADPGVPLDLSVS